ncbi:MAG: OmpA family protein [Bacteroidales bacterium]|nr:OmpA family protein [Bacteroidales bacterium]
MKFVFAFLTFIILQNADSNQVDSSDPKQFKQLFSNAEKSFQLKDYKNAILTYKELLEIDSSNNNLHFLLGYSYLMNRSGLDLTIKHLERSIPSVHRWYREGAYHERNVPALAYFLLGKAYHKNYQFDQAVEAFENYKSYLDFLSFAEIEYVNRHIRSVDLARGMVKHPLSVEFIPMAEHTDENFSCSHPVVSGKDSMMIFSIEKKDGNHIAMILRQTDGWTAPRVLGIGREMPGTFYPVSVSYDGSELYLVYKDALISDLYVSTFVGKDWSNPQKLGSGINSTYDETHASISSDGQDLYFTSNRRGGWGGLDIYVSHKNEEGAWMEPVNLGYGINTYYNENTPFITQNDSVLYYSSEGFHTIGGYDIYVTRVEQDVFFIEPQHLGYPISTPDDDLFFNPGWDEITSYYARKPEDKSLTSSIFTIINGTRDALVNSSMDVEQKIDEHYYFVNTILFEFDEFTLNENARKEIEHIFSMMHRNPDIEIELIGHTDDIGTSEYNLGLSKKRAQSVKNHLIEKGISEDRIGVLSSGEDDPLAINSYEDGTDAPLGRSLNRNVLIRINNEAGDNIRMAEIFVPPSLVPVQDKVYTVFLLESDQLLDTLPDEILGQPVSLIYTDSSKIYAMGNYNLITDAHEYLDKVIDNGYPEAYIIEKRNFENAIRKRTHGNQMENLQYTIQIMALKIWGEMSIFPELDSVRIFKGNDGFHRVVYGTFNSIDDAQRVLPKIKKMEKYNNAFIRPLSFYENISPE